MKYLVILIFSVCVFSCQSGKTNNDKIKESEQEVSNTDLEISNSESDLINSDLYDPLEDEEASSEENYQVALDFINSYIESMNEVEILEFAKKSGLATADFIAALETIVILAWEENPRIGLTADPLLDAQDYPAEGFELHEFNSPTGYVIVKGIGWEDFKVAMNVVSENGHLLVDGCGIVNMRESQRIER